MKGYLVYLGGYCDEGVYDGCELSEYDCCGLAFAEELSGLADTSSLE